MRRIFSVLLILCCSGNLLLAQQQPATFKLANHTGILLSPATDWSAMPRANSSPGQVLVRMAAGVRLPKQDQNILWQQSLGGDDYLLLLQPKATALPAGAAFFVRMQPQWKMDASLWNLSAGNKPVEVLISVAPVAATLFPAFLNQLQGRVTKETGRGNNYYEIELPENKLYQLAGWYGTLSVSPKAHPQSLNHESKVVTRTELMQAPLSAGGAALQGEGMVIGVGDNANGLDHVDLRDRIINYNPWPFGSHGIHINGIVGGAGIMNPNARGFAPRATLVDHPYSNVWQRTGEMVSSHGMSITNNSYAAVVGNCDFAGTYDGYAALLDSIALAYPEVLHVFASGNDGGNTCAPYAKGFHTVVGAYQAAKNVLVVGNIHKNTSIETASSRGPVKDGRIKPEVCAVGINVFSCKNDDTYQAAGGTSMACPQVSGLAALLSQRYKQIHGTLPQATLLKAVLMNGAMDLGQPGPDFIYGFGAVNGIRSLEMLNNSFYFTGTVADGANVSHSVIVPAGTSKMKVLLYWHDAPASLLPAQKLVNDLDLEVKQGGVTYLPFVLDTSAAQLNAPATTGIDRLNNVEQVVIETPVAGVWDINIKGFQVPEGPQEYVLVYVFEDSGLSISYPFAGAVELSADSLRIAWEAPVGTNTFSVEFSANGGATWTMLSSNVNALARNYAYKLPALNANNCQVRVSRNGTSLSAATGNFVVSKATTMTVSDSTRQCPGAFTWQWTNPGTEVTAFEILQKKGPELVPIDTVSGSQLSYTLTGLWQDSMYYVAVRPFINGTPGKQSKGLRRKPSSGLCTLPVFQGDLAITNILNPGSGRLLTSTALTASEPLKVLVRNWSSVPATNYTVFYQVNAGPVQNLVFNAPSDVMAPVTAKELTVGNVDLSAAGSYLITAWIVNNASPDLIHENDTVRASIRQLPNNALTVSTPYAEGFESFDPAPLTRDTMGFGPDSRWDYSNSSDSGRLRAWVNTSIPVTGSRAMSMDAYLNRPGGIANLLMATFNFASYAGTTYELRADFDYKLHGIPGNMDSNRLWFRGSDADPWQVAYIYDTTQPAGTVMHSGSIPLNDLLTAAGQTFSASTQFLFAQKDTSLIAENAYGNGMTVDNFTIYRVQKDVAVNRIAAPGNFSCGGNASQPVSVVVYNTVTQPQINVPVWYRFNGGPAVMETIPLIPGKDSVTWTFTPAIDLHLPGLYNLDVFIAAPGDTYLSNDSILNYSIRIQAVIDSFPYLEDFEGSNGGWYAAGANSSWFWGSPVGTTINKAASGEKVWMSNTGFGYNSNELSYLYSPCFDIGTMTQPMLSFSQSMEIENCGASLCDFLQMEYSFDEGATWQKLGLAGEGTNWYNDSVNHVWSQLENGRWHVSSIPLPAAPPGAMLQLRYRLSTDPGTNLDGAAIDDIHIFDLKYPIHEGASFATATLAGDSLVQFISDNRIMAEVHTGGQNLGEGQVTTYQHSDLIAPLLMQYVFPRSFLIRSVQQPADSLTLRLYVLESEANSFFNATGCVPCTLPDDVYRMGANRYTDPDTARENGSMADNEFGTYYFYDHDRIRWVPYDKGYYAEFKTSGFSEYWFGDSGVIALPLVLLSFDAWNEGNRNRIEWETAMEENLSNFELEHSEDGISFQPISSISAAGHAYNYTAYDTKPFTGFTYYRLKMVFQNGAFLYSKTVRAFMKGHNGFELIVSPNPAEDLITIRIPGSNNEGTLRLTDVSGRVIRQQAVYYGLSTMDISGLARGVYFLKYTDGQHSGTVKVEKQ